MHQFPHAQRTAPGPLAGVGLKAAHVPALLERGPERFLGGAGFLEVHAENYMVDGGPMLRHLERVRALWPLSIHGVGLSIGGAGPMDRDHLDRLSRLVTRFEPRWCSEHLAWSSHGVHWFNDLLPLPYDAATLQRVCDHIDQVQERLRRQLLLENPSTYLGYANSTMDEASFLAEVVRRTGCGLLLDINNAHVSGVNHGCDPWALIEALIEAVPAAAVAEIHLAGFAEDRDAAGDRLLIDHHGDDVDQAVWSLYERTIARLGPVPTLIERDNHLPPLAALEHEAQRALDLQRAICEAGADCRAAA
jgi:uncharacterized protein (UPF0276 family)